MSIKFKNTNKLIPRAQKGIAIQKIDAINKYIPNKTFNSIPLTLQQQNN